MAEDPEAQALRQAIEDQKRLDKERRDAMEAEVRAKRDREANEQDRADEAARLRRHAGESE